MATKPIPERVRMPGPGGTIGHAELELGDSLVMLSDPFPQSSVRAPKELGGASATVFMYVEDVDAVVKQAVDAGATCDDGGRGSAIARGAETAASKASARSSASRSSGTLDLPRRHPPYSGV
jgi:hypothetical protein